jgi:hypothetical protein
MDNVVWIIIAVVVAILLLAAVVLIARQAAQRGVVSKPNASASRSVRKP